MTLTHDQAREIIEVYQPELYRLAYSLTRSAPAAAKICDDNLLAGLKRRAQTKAPGGENDLRLWMARRVVSASAWQNWLGGVKTTLADILDALRETEGRDGPAEAGAAYGASGLWPAYLALPPAGQRVIALRYFHNYSLPQVASLLATSENGAARQLSEARHRLDSAAGGPHGMLGRYTSGLTHTQVRQLIQSSVEYPVKGQPWMALQTHLEGCPACRSYRQRLDLLQRELGRALAPYLSPPQPAGPQEAARLLSVWEKKIPSRTA